jgi:FkbM family methyltransferase
MKSLSPSATRRMALDRIRVSGMTLVRELRGFRSFVGWRGRQTYIFDLVIRRLLVRGWVRPGKAKSLRHRSGAILTYRKEVGDLDTIVEVWVEQIYELPFPYNPQIVVDLGAHIGLASVWFKTAMRANFILAVEPSHGNVALLRKNLSQNNVSSLVLEGAISSEAGTGYLGTGRASNVGRLSSSGTPVRLITMDELCSYIDAEAEIDILKVDVEGGEDALLRYHGRWLARVAVVVAEFHPPVVDDIALTELLMAHGYRHWRSTAQSSNPGHVFRCFPRTDFRPCAQCAGSEAK